MVSLPLRFQEAKETNDTNTGGASPKSNAGGRTPQGSGTPRNADGYYYGGSAVPYRSGWASPSGISPFFAHVPSDLPI